MTLPLLLFFFFPLLHRTALYFSRPLPEIEKQLGRDDDDDSSQSQPENVAAVAAATRLQSLTSGASSRLAPDCRKKKNRAEGEPGRVAAGLCVKTEASLDTWEGGGASGGGELGWHGVQQVEDEGGKVSVAENKKTTRQFFSSGGRQRSFGLQSRRFNSVEAASIIYLLDG